ncbi:MAG TPA: DegT/DnrJ/EryC1/StrS family aminotransferase [Eudoraea sp.]|nr:DegT/DnrJ/EryC1/StrS family aminotransferase [Eudoraea sp.]
MVKFLDLQRQYSTISSEIDQAIKKVIGQSAFIGGKEIKDFEGAFAAFQNAEYCVGLANGTDALEIAIEALDLPPKSEIIVPANSFISSSEAVTRLGHRVVFCDCDKHNYTISLQSLKQKITPQTKAVIAVHLYGHPCDMDGIMKISEAHDLRVIEDCAQAHGAEFRGKRIGAIGHIGTFSFYPGKNLGAYGDAGAILTNDFEVAKKCRMIANHGRIEKYNHVFEGRNSRLDNLQAAILNVKLKYIEDWTRQRIAIADYYLTRLKEIGQVVLPKRESWARQVYHLFVIRTRDRDDLKRYLQEKKIQTGIHYPIALPKLEAYAYTGQGSEDFFANKSDVELLSLPIGEHMSLQDAEQVVLAIRGYYGTK